MLRPGGELLAASYGAMFIFWSLATRQQIGPSLTGNFLFQKLAFSPEGKSLLALNYEHAGQGYATLRLD